MSEEVRAWRRGWGLFGGASAGVIGACYKCVAAWPVAHLHALDALEALGVGLGLRQGGLGVRRSLWYFLGGTHLSGGAQALACESDAQMQNRSFAGLARLLSRLLLTSAAVSWGTGSHMVPTTTLAVLAPKKLEGCYRALNRHGTRAFPLVCTHGVPRSYLFFPSMSSANPHRSSRTCPSSYDSRMVHFLHSDRHQINHKLDRWEKRRSGEIIL